MCAARQIVTETADRGADAVRRASDGLAGVVRIATNVRVLTNGRRMARVRVRGGLELRLCVAKSSPMASPFASPACSATCDTRGSIMCVLAYETRPKMSTNGVASVQESEAPVGPGFAVQPAPTFAVNASAEHEPPFSFDVEGTLFYSHPHSSDLLHLLNPIVLPKQARLPCRFTTFKQFS